MAMTLLPVWFKGMTPELQMKAEVELGETTDVKETALREFRSLINEHHDIYSRQDDLFLLRFLRAKKYDVQKSFKVLCNYYAMRAKHCRKKPSELKHVFAMNNFTYAPYRISPGSHVGIFLMGRYDIGKASAEDFVGSIVLVGEIILECEATQICGGINIVDLKGMSLLHYVKFLSVSFLSLVISILQDCWPERIKCIHFVNEPFLLHALHRLFRPMLKQKLNERFHFHGSDLGSLHAHVPKAFLPQELGGTLGPLENTEFTDYVLSQEAYIERINKYGLIGRTSK